MSHDKFLSKTFPTRWKLGYFVISSIYPVSKFMWKHVGVKTCQGEVFLLSSKSADGVTQKSVGLLINKCLKVYMGVICFVLVVLKYFSLGHDQSSLLILLQVLELSLGKSFLSSPVHKFLELEIKWD